MPRGSGPRLTTTWFCTVKLLTTRVLDSATLTVERGRTYPRTRGARNERAGTTTQRSGAKVEKPRLAPTTKRGGTGAQPT